MTHKLCLYPDCHCIAEGATCKVSDAAERGLYCSHCGMDKADVERGSDCGFYEVCSRGGAVMIDPAEAMANFIKSMSRRRTDDKIRRVK